MKKDIWFFVLVISLLLSACESQPTPPTADANSIAQTAVAVVWTGVAQTKEAEPSAIPTISSVVLTQIATTQMVEDKNSYKAIDYNELVASDDHVMEKIVLSGTVTAIGNEYLFTVQVDPNYLGNVSVTLLLPATDLKVGDFVKVYGLYTGRIKMDEKNGEEIYIICLNDAFFEK